LGSFGWLVFVMFSVVRLVSHLAQIKSIGYLGAPLVSTLMPLRLISALYCSMILLGEGFTSSNQMLGGVLVFLTVGGYLWTNRTH